MATQTQPQPGTAVAASGEAQKPFAVALLEQHGSRIQDLLPPGVSLERVAATLRLEIMKNPKIADCTAPSLIMTLGRIFRWGLEIGESAYIVPFYDSKKKLTEATAIMGYNGMVDLMVASGSVRAVQAKAVYANDLFRYELGLNQQLQHVPDSNPATRGALIGAYCILRLGRGADDVFDYMGVEEIETIRAKSKQWGPDKVAACPAWYAVKTIVRRTSKLVPKNPRLARALSVIDEELGLEPEDQVGTVSAPATASRTLPDHRGPRPLAAPSNDPYGASEPALIRTQRADGSHGGGTVNSAPVPPAQHSDDPGARAEDYPADFDDTF